MAFTVRAASRTEVATLIDWAAAEGWNPGLGDLDPFLAADAQGFLVGLVDGEPVAGVSVVRSGPHFGFLGFYLCAPAHRGRGFGYAVWQAGMARLEARTVGLDGVVGQQANYARSGFSLAHRNIRHAGRAPTTASADPAIRAILPGDLPALTAFDARHYGAARPEFLAAWIAPESGRIARLVVVGGQIAGFGVIRPCREGLKIGPLFAEDAHVAEALFCALAAEANGDMVILDTPEPNAEALALARRHGLAPVFETARMYRGPPPWLPLDGIFGITTFELG